MTAPILRGLSDLRAKHAGWIRAGESVAVVPTMGALPAGHLSLVEAACAASDRVFLTIFVNPRQFNKAADLANCPRTPQHEAETLSGVRVDHNNVQDAHPI